jgi:hypothetical protein
MVVVFPWASLIRTCLAKRDVLTSKNHYSLNKKIICRLPKLIESMLFLQEASINNHKILAFRIKVLNRLRISIVLRWLVTSSPISGVTVAVPWVLHLHSCMRGYTLRIGSFLRNVKQCMTLTGGKEKRRRNAPSGLRSRCRKWMGWINMRLLLGLWMSSFKTWTRT